MSKKYQRRISDLIRSHLTDLLGRKANDPRLQMVTITDVAVTSDTRYADVHYSVLGGAEVQAELSTQQYLLLWWSAVHQLYLRQVEMLFSLAGLSSSGKELPLFSTYS